MNKANSLTSRCKPATRSRVIGFGWHDGVTEGVAADDGNNNAISFRLLARNSERKELYIYAISFLNDGVFAQIVRELKVLGPPRWPVWVPKWQFDRPEERARVELFLEQLCIDDAPVECVVVSAHILKPFLANRSVTDESQRSKVEILKTIGITFQEWIDYIDGRGQS